MKRLALTLTSVMLVLPTHAGFEKDRKHKEFEPFSCMGPGMPRCQLEYQEDVDTPVYWGPFKIGVKGCTKEAWYKRQKCFE